MRVCVLCARACVRENVQQGQFWDQKISPVQGSLDSADHWGMNEGGKIRSDMRKISLAKMHFSVTEECLLSLSLGTHGVCQLPDRYSLSCQIFRIKKLLLFLNMNCAEIDKFSSCFPPPLIPEDYANAAAFSSFATLFSRHHKESRKFPLPLTT